MNSLSSLTDPNTLFSIIFLFAMLLGFVAMILKGKEPEDKKDPLFIEGVFKGKSLN